MIIKKRSSGILLHITSLPSPYGIGDLGPEAYKFADLLAEAGQRYWQILPLNPTETGSGNSPYSSHSAFAGNPLLLSPQLLLEDGLLHHHDLEHTDFSFRDDKVMYEEVTRLKHRICLQAYENFRTQPSTELRTQFAAFIREHSEWIEDYGQYVAFKNHFEHKSWVDWADEIKYRQERPMLELAHELAMEIEREQFLQFLFYRQWENLKKYCNKQQIYLIGDMPFYVSHDSADIWSHPHYFKLDGTGQPVASSGVPPDYFSETGQLWGTPVFDWEALEKQNFDWWVRRISHNLRLFDLLRLDHFRAFSAYWEVPASERTAINGKWVSSPGAKILSIVKIKHPEMPIIAEDLGEIDEPVRDLMQQFDLPGMRLLIFAFGDDMPRNAYTPHNHIKNSIIYTGTHDNYTMRGWFETQASYDDKSRLGHYTNTHLTADNVHEVMGRLAYGSVAQLAVLPLQDVLGLGAEATMNKPSTTDHNWEWRLKPGLFDWHQAQKLQKLMWLYNR
ncbi:4-alpha-glucanotransferase [Pontibacter beigongshangensis]|uniref:4-alpha-glucanotransferase n=1 Tax=Pontibacter beigongshangensis TaxID=2574733 RepID=UPI00164F00E7|nr:4-alpha-glucanotransferase [Pontibacter beigongshangensis]